MVPRFIRRALGVVALAAACLNALCDLGVGDQSAGDGPDVIAQGTLGGIVDARDFTVPAGQITTVTSDLTVNATGNVRLGGQLVAEAATTPGSNGAKITIIAQGNIEILGIVQAGNGVAGAEAGAGATTAKAILAAQTIGAAGHLAGGDGGAIVLTANGNLTLAETANITCGSGGSGRNGDIGATGGKGGDLYLDAGGTLTIRGTLYLGNGGNGGQALPTIALGAEPVFSTNGGASGFLYLGGATVDWPGYDPTTNAYDPHSPAALASPGTGVGGGVAGDAGAVVIEVSDSTAAARLIDQSPDASHMKAPFDFCIGPVCSYTSPDGPNGWIFGGRGSDIRIEIKYLTPNVWDGSAITGRAGHGGNVTRMRDLNGRTSVLNHQALAGWGGDAQVIASDGRVGNTQHLVGGNGGFARAFGGNGGSAEMGTPQQAGGGGFGIAMGGSGGDGYVPPQGGIFEPPVCDPSGNGGAGGEAEAWGGNGGSGGYAGPAGGAWAIGGSGGNGARAGGAGGRTYATRGETGEGIPPPYSVAIPVNLPGEQTAVPGTGGQAVLVGCGS